MKRYYLPLFWKFSLAIISIVLVFGGTYAFLVWKDVQIALERESEKRGLFIAQNLSQQCTDLLLYEDLVAIQKLLDRAALLDSSIAYVALLDRNHQPLVHTFESSVPRDLIFVNLPKKGERQSIQLIIPRDKPGQIIRDIAIPLLDGRLGYIRVGLNESGLHASSRHFLQDFGLIALIFLAVGILGAFFFSHVISRPIKNIHQIADHLDFSVLEQRSLPKIIIRDKFWGRWPMRWRMEDEIDHLVQKFNDMILRLENAYSDLSSAHHKLLQSEKMASIGTVAAGLAHEINNPLAGVQNCLNRINRNPNNLEQNAKYIKMMNEATMRIEQVVRQILNFSRKQDFDFRAVSLAEVISKALLLVAYRLEKAQIQFEQKIPANLPPVRGSAHHLEQIFVNLMMNSIDAIEEKAAQNGSFKKLIEFRAFREVDQIYCYFEDNGNGIPEDKISKIFSPFFTTKQIGKGTGLGLAVSYNIIQAHNGRIEVDSEVGKGTRVMIWLPVYKSQRI